MYNANTQLTSVPFDTTLNFYILYHNAKRESDALLNNHTGFKIISADEIDINEPPSPEKKILIDFLKNTGRNEVKLLQALVYAGMDDGKTTEKYLRNLIHGFNSNISREFLTNKLNAVAYIKNAIKHLDKSVNLNNLI